MKVSVVGATGVVGSAVVRALVEAGHDVCALARTADKASLVERWGATAVHADLSEPQSLVTMFEGCDVVVNTASRCLGSGTHGRVADWRADDRLRVEGARTVTAAAREAHVRRLVQASSSLLYADAGDAWIDEDAPLAINPVTEPACEAESLAEEFRSDLRQVVVLRLGVLVGDDPTTRRALHAARRGRPVWPGPVDGWVHPLHTDDVGPAFAAAVGAPGGTYNVGAEPVRRWVLQQTYARAVGRSEPGSGGLWRLVRSGKRAEPATRSLRVSSERFREAAGWMPRRAAFEPSWLRPAEPAMWAV